MFQPYSGVKTSVLILDKKLAKKSQHILFLKIENDGFDLGAQRREIDKNDLPVALQTLETYKDCLSNDKHFEDLPSLATLVEKETVLGNKDVVLSAERYFENIDSRVKNYPTEKVSSLIDFVRGVTYSKDEEVSENGIKILRANNISIENKLDFNDIKLINPNAKVKEQQKLYKGDILICTASGSADHIGKVAFIEFDLDCYFGGFMGVIRTNEKVNSRFLFEILKAPDFREHLTLQISSTNIRNLKSDVFESFEIPLPPIEIQQQIVTEIEGYQKIIDGAKQIVNNYKPTITINPDWEMVELGKVCKFSQGVQVDINLQYPIKKENQVRFLRIIDFTQGNQEPRYIDKPNDKYYVNNDDISMVRYGATGFVCTGKEGVLANNLFKITPTIDNLNKRYLYFILKSSNVQDIIAERNQGVAMPAISFGTLNEIEIPIPSLEEQLTIVKAIEEELQLVNANKRLIEIFEQKIKTKIGEVWGVVPEPVEGKEEVEKA